jgi:uncharacterized protein YqjF (DUF2071 family)
MHPALSKIDHRPWALPGTPWTWRQSWCDLLFAHWRIEAKALRSLVPPSLAIQEFDGSSWIGVVPFRMAGVMRRPFPDIPGLSAFPELNLRLYVERDGKPGVWFLSLDATNPIAVWAARRMFHLPYFHADIDMKRASDTIEYTSTRHSSPSAARFRAMYRPTSDVYHSTPGTLEHFLTERYCLYAQSPEGRVFRADVHHLPWPLQHADAEIHENRLHLSHGLTVSGPPETLHFARRLDVVVWTPTVVADRATG